MGSRRFSLALEHISDNNDTNKPITAFLIDKRYANYENSNPCLKPVDVHNNLQLKKCRSAPVINDMFEQTCRLQSDNDKVFAMVPKRRFSICDLNTFDSELPGIMHHTRHEKVFSSEPATCPSSSISEGRGHGNAYFPKKHCRRNSVALKFQNPRSIDNSIETEQ
mmetsp:Transcript_7902/g.7837  ORF Transcript_7902/g.7837 Transcript_7902/m.7837 type:complete len:165 (+) Transcript_7902:537-1031(+)